MSNKPTLEEYQLAVKHLDKNMAALVNNGLFSQGRFIGYDDGDESIVLDGGFTIKDLEAIATYMKWHAVT